MSFNQVNKKEARKFSDTVNSALKAHVQPTDIPSNVQIAPSASAQQVDVVEQLKKFAELRDTGILTEEEFQTQKTKLLQS